MFSCRHYVTSYEEFDTKKFIDEFTKKFNLENGQALPQYELLNILGYQNCFKLSDNEYRQKTIDLISFAETKAFNPADYLTVMHFAERFNNILNLNLEEVCNTIIGGLKKSISNTVTNSARYFSQFEMSGRGSEMSDYNKEIYKAGMAEIAIIKEKSAKEKIESKFFLLLSNIKEFENKYHYDEDFRNTLLYSPFLSHIEPSKVFEIISKSENETINFFKYFFQDIYKDRGKIENEYEHLKELINLLIDFMKQETEKNGKTIRNYLINEFIEFLIKIIDTAREKQR